MTHLLKKFARIGAVAASLTLAATLVPAVASSAPAWAGASPQAQLAMVRQATAAYHDIAAAENAGYGPALNCFDDPQLGGMGQHFINGNLMDGTADLLHPEALVYQDTLAADGTHDYRLVAVEYIVPDSFARPSLLGKEFTPLPALGIWKLHAWIWKPNPAGMFADYNHDVRMCPAA